VLDGYAGLDAAFSPMPKTFALHWFDFYDPDSGLVRAGATLDFEAVAACLCPFVLSPHHLDLTMCAGAV
jgi:hypothetical protein